MSGELVAVLAAGGLTYTYGLVRLVLSRPGRERARVSATWIGLAFLGWALATFFVGLWWGERGRRMDAYLEVGRRAHDTAPERAEIRRIPDAEEKAIAHLVDQERKQIISGLRNAARIEGRKVSKSQVEQDADQMIAQLTSSQGF